VILCPAVSARVTACCPTVTATRFARRTIRRARGRARAIAARPRDFAREAVLRRLRPVDLLRPRDERDLRAALERPRDERLDFLRPLLRDLLPLDLRALAIVTSPVAVFDSTVRKNRAHLRYPECTV